ncbi:MAG: iron transporter [Bacteroidota bacterium]|nr:iron transporter [Bacteroidota bacterium]
MTPSRIISLVPSITLLLFDLGLEDNIAGRTKFCIHPEEKAKNIPTIGGTKNVNLQKIKALKPDLIIANKEENEREQIEALQREFNVLVTDIETMEDNYKMIEEIGRITEREDKAENIIKQTKANFLNLEEFISKSSNFQINTLYLIWRKPYMTIGNDTFIHGMLQTIGLKNIFGDEKRYPVIEDLGELSTVNCELVLLSSEPYPFKENHIAEIQQQLPNAKVLLVDGEFFSWYGSKMIHAPAYFLQLLNTIHDTDKFPGIKKH